MLQDGELQALLTRTKLTRLASSVAEEDTADAWRQRLKADREAFFSYLRSLGVTKTGERLAIANALRNARTEELPSSSASVCAVLLPPGSALHIT